VALSSLSNAVLCVSRWQLIDRVCAVFQGREIALRKRLFRSDGYESSIRIVTAHVGNTSILALHGAVLLWVLDSVVSIYLCRRRFGSFRFYTPRRKSQQTEDDVMSPYYAFAISAFVLILCSRGSLRFQKCSRASLAQAGTRDSPFSLRPDIIRSV
jgi:hypothetical protein